MSKLKSMALVATLSCLGAVLGIFENMLPVLTAIPGGKLGIANTVTVITLYVMGIPHSFAVSVLRVIVSCILYGGINAFMYSFAGAITSFGAMAAAKKLLDNKISPIGISVLGAAIHNTAQVAVAWCVLRTDALLWYLAMLFLISVFSGFACGWISKECVNRLKIRMI